MCFRKKGRGRRLWFGYLPEFKMQKAKGKIGVPCSASRDQWHLREGLTALGTWHPSSPASSRLVGTGRATQGRPGTGNLEPGTWNSERLDD